MSNINSLGSKHSNAMTVCIQIRESKGSYHKNAYGNWQLSLYIHLELKMKPRALSSHDRRKLASGLRKEGGRIDDFATVPNAHAPGVNRCTYRI